MSITLRTRMAILVRDGFTCQYCGARAPRAFLEVDHVVPRSRGGSDLPDNLVAACFACNHGKMADLIYPPEWVEPTLPEPAPAIEEAEIIIQRAKRPRDFTVGHPQWYLDECGRKMGECPWCETEIYGNIGGSVLGRKCRHCKVLYHGLDCVWKHIETEHDESDYATEDVDAYMQAER